MVTLHVAFAAMALSGVSQTVLLDFYSDSCGPCRAMNPTIEALIKAGYPVQRVNVGLAGNRGLVAKFGVTAWPCFIMVANGREVDRVVGWTSMSRLQEMYEKGSAATRATGPPAQPTLTAARRRSSFHLRRRLRRRRRSIRGRRPPQRSNNLLRSR